MLPLFKDERMSKILSVLDHCEYYPKKSNVFKVFEMPVGEIRVVILGQSPYPKDISTGLAFASTQSTYSLNVIFNEIERSFYYNDFDTSRIETDQKDLLHWHKQGVFLLNTALTTTVDKSHYQYWKWFTTSIIEFISNHHLGIIWMQWGKQAQEFDISSKDHYVLKAPLPSKGLFATDNEFIGCNHFSICNKILGENNGEIIYWNKFEFSKLFKY